MSRNAKKMQRPTEEYLKICAQPLKFSSISSSPTQKKLVILDLNGTLVYRGERARCRTQPTCRPGLKPFLDFLFSSFHVMVWSSSTRGSVDTMSRAIFTELQRELLVASWARDTLRLTREQYISKVQTFKNLEWVWESTELREIHQFSQTDTIIIDDTQLKLQRHPYNLIEVPEFTAELCRSSKDDVLAKVQMHLERLKLCENVSAYLAQIPLNLTAQPAAESQDDIDSIQRLVSSFDKQALTPEH